VSRSFPIISWQNEYEFFKGNNARNAVRREIITYFETKKKLIYKKNEGVIYEPQDQKHFLLDIFFHFPVSVFEKNTLMDFSTLYFKF